MVTHEPDAAQYAVAYCSCMMAVVAQLTNPTREAILERSRPWTVGVRGSVGSGASAGWMWFIRRHFGIAADFTGSGVIRLIQLIVLVMRRVDWRCGGNAGGSLADSPLNRNQGARTPGIPWHS
ncbi:hypothetical protein [Mobiluncus mulieris]|uniref:hypothetical protein n=1 Tax=Mobiluncus mulieris TaxID=2052 RepID=UPI00209296B7|nr:hypothetical protein [Mobiluncus mulieris]